jgi:hypothetical protein
MKATDVAAKTVFFDLECGEGSSVFALGAVFGAHPPLTARNAEQVKQKMPVFRDWVRSAQYVCGHNCCPEAIVGVERKI